MTTKGEYRVGISFNPSADTTVDKLKRAAADLIDLIEGIDASGPRDGEKARLKALAQTEIESAAMWAVKAATKPEAPESYDLPPDAPSPTEDLFIKTVREAVAANADPLRRDRPLYDIVMKALLSAGFRDVTEAEVANAIVDVQRGGR